MTSIYVLELNNNKYYITEIENDANNANILAKIDIIKKLPWVKKHNIKSLRKMIDTNKTIRIVSIEYIKKYGIENVRSDLIQSETVEPSILAEINSTTYDKMKFASLDNEINMLKNIHDTITDNDNSLLKYKKIFLADTNMINKYKNVYDLLTTMNKWIFIEFNLLKPGFAEEYIGHITQILKKIKGDGNNQTIKTDVTPEELESTLKQFFSDFETLEEISNGLVIQKKNEKLISKYGSIEEIKEKLTKLFAEKIILLQSLNIDDLSETDFQNDDEDEEDEDEDEDEEEDDEEEDEDDEDEDEDEDDKEEDKNKIIENDEQYENKLAVIYKDKLKYENIVNQVIETNTKPLEYYVIFISGHQLSNMFIEFNNIISAKINENSKLVGGINIVCNIDGEYTLSQSLVKPVSN
jgi:hypothetical protein